MCACLMVMSNVCAAGKVSDVQRRFRARTQMQLLSFLCYPPVSFILAPLPRIHPVESAVAEVGMLNGVYILFGQLSHSI